MDSTQAPFEGFFFVLEKHKVQCQKDAGCIASCPITWLAKVKDAEKCERESRVLIGTSYYEGLFDGRTEFEVQTEVNTTCSK